MHAEVERKNEAIKKTTEKVIKHVVNRPEFIRAAQEKGINIEACKKKGLEELWKAISVVGSGLPQAADVNYAGPPSKQSISLRFPPKTPVGSGAQIYTAHQLLTRNEDQTYIGHPDISTFTEQPGIIYPPNGQQVKSSDGYFKHEMESEYLFREHESEGSNLEKQKGTVRQLPAHQPELRKKSTTGAAERKVKAASKKSSVQETRAAVKQVISKNQEKMAAHQSRPTLLVPSDEESHILNECESAELIPQMHHNPFVKHPKKLLHGQNSSNSLGSPIVMNSYSSIYKQRDISKNSRNSKGSAKFSQKRDGSFSGDAVRHGAESVRAQIPSQQQLLSSFIHNNLSGARQLNNPVIFEAQQTTQLPSNSSTPQEHQNYATQLTRSNTLGCISGRQSNLNVNKHKQFKQNQQKQSKTIRGVSRQATTEQP